MPDYKESTVAGTSWQRARRVVIENPLDGAPTILFVEERAVRLDADSSAMTTPCDQLMAQFDPSNQLHLDIYSKLNELYTLLRGDRDARAAAPPTGGEV